MGCRYEMHVHTKEISLCAGNYGLWADNHSGRQSRLAGLPGTAMWWIC